ncbi:MAG: alpha/beta hydrolase [Chitinophagaceae bacterium]|nr:MAG: alpha/beta hydrolase [Chitinophagaceae bacterium]
MNVYFISGLGADRRAFERLKLPEQFTIHYLDWIKPMKGESLNAYARRLAAAIDTSQPFSIVGLSMGGMIAAAMTQFLQPYKTVLISSIGCNSEFPPLLKFARKTKTYKILPSAVFRPKNLWLIQRMFGTKATAEKKLIQYFISNTDPYFMKWAIDAIITWQDCERPETVFQIHGNKDKMFPIKYTKPDVVIEKGSHFMVFTKAGEVSRILEQALA